VLHIDDNILTNGRKSISGLHTYTLCDQWRMTRSKFDTFEVERVEVENVDWHICLFKWIKFTEWIYIWPKLISWPQKIILTWVRYKYIWRYRANAYKGTGLEDEEDLKKVNNECSQVHWWRIVEAVHLSSLKVGVERKKDLLLNKRKYVSPLKPKSNMIIIIHIFIDSFRVSFRKSSYWVVDCRRLLVCVC